MSVLLPQQMTGTTLEQDDITGLISGIYDIVSIVIHVYIKFIYLIGHFHIGGPKECARLVGYDW